MDIEHEPSTMWTFCGILYSTSHFFPLLTSTFWC